MNAPLLPAADLHAVARRDDRSAAWFDNLSDGVLTVRSCTDCGHSARPDAAACPQCRSEALGWVPARGTGTVVAAITDHAPVREGGEPLTVGLVELDEGPWLHVRLLGSPTIGDQVSLVVLVPEDGESIPAFRRL